ncbi:hypothetical protein COCSUDRAFT_63830 [Coccomyxa subellipsoidea C-169]|uniref:Uncharacterized protein n=1 Tax=Coccomyxa subellipsoidea (strain C-169) TaxID=574566 RepID=I0YWC3_COCSC|nr:hypothetical protein COCSUDRAFT_63830 [Coccomyxa subellipsoidea C-169]EIE22692.1 hypothetical protein COCSUDRAFT_63830 [Coccomyxa subellipsoidea C-169]|eukprot:XP_005647236.1 hypothetical protein COCSUDRAFT_63830 [Coccomyxa subellipsoidea C-169]
MRLLVALAAFVAVVAISAQGQSPPPAIIDIGVGASAGNPIVQIPTSTNPNGQLTGQVISVMGGDPTAVKAQVLKSSTNSDPGTTVTTGGTFNVLGTSGGTTATVQTTGGTFTPITSEAVGDPEIRAFDGETFEFEGTPGSFYEAVGDQDHQVSVFLKVGHMWDHNGTYMQGMGMKAHGQEILVTLSDDDCLQVTANNEVLHVPDDGTYGLNTTLGKTPSAVHLDWKLFREKLGNSVRVSTETMTITVYMTRAGIKDKGGVEQPAYLNFEATLNRAPDHDLRGFMGQSYNNVRSSTRKLQAVPEWGYHHNASEYELPDYFSI